MRCIEIIFGGPNRIHSEEINLNMRCIEMGCDDVAKGNKILINLNMRCIEISTHTIHSMMLSR